MAKIRHGIVIAENDELVNKKVEVTIRNTTMPYELQSKSVGSYK